MFYYKNLISILESSFWKWPTIHSTQWLPWPLRIFWIISVDWGEKILFPLMLRLIWSLEPAFLMFKIMSKVSMPWTVSLSKGNIDLSTCLPYLQHSLFMYLYVLYNFCVVGIRADVKIGTSLIKIQRNISL